MGKTHAKKIVVKKGPERIAYRIMAGVFFAGWVVTLLIPDTRDYALAFPLGYLIVGFPFHFYYEVWRITITAKEIRIRRWIFCEKTYSYTMIKEVTKEKFTSERYFRIRCVFTDGKNISFSVKDVNADLAIKRLLSRGTIRTVRY